MVVVGGRERWFWLTPIVSRASEANKNSLQKDDEITPYYFVLVKLGEMLMVGRDGPGQHFLGEKGGGVPFRRHI